MLQLMAAVSEGKMSLGSSTCSIQKFEAQQQNNVSLSGACFLTRDMMLDGSGA
jgi:hypothetical protein